LPDFPYLLRFCRRLQDAGLDLITLHPRLAAEKFKRRARWDYVTALREELAIPVAGNGDIASAAELAEKTSAGPVMAGRLLVREPWAFAKAVNLAAASSNPAANDAVALPASPCSASRSPVYPSIEETGLRFLELLARYQPPEFHLSRARRFFRYYCDNLTWAEHMRNTINREETLTGIEKVWREYFAVTDNGVRT
jgi:tRNA-dihydrouridine synthase